MDDLLIDLDDEVWLLLKESAELHGVEIEEEALAILRRALLEDVEPTSDAG